MIGSMLILVVTISLGQGWNSTVTTSVSVVSYPSIENFANVNGINVVNAGHSSDPVVYTLLNSRRQTSE